MKHLIQFTLLVIAAFNLFGCGSAKELTKAINSPEGVDKIKIKYAKIDEIPDEIEKLKDLETLYLFKNDLKEIPEEIGQLTNESSVGVIDTY